MINELTPSQKRRLPKYIEKYIKLASKPTDKVKAKKAIENLYKFAGYDKPIIVFGSSPYETSIMCALFRLNNSELYSELGSKLHSELSSELESKLDSELGSELKSKLRSELESKLYLKLGSELGSELKSKLRSELKSKLYLKLGSELGSELRSELSSKLSSKLYSELKDVNNDWWLTIWWLAWAGYYDYARYIGVDFNKKKYKIFMDFVTNVGFLIPYEGICFVSESPTQINWQGDNLGSLTNPAIEYQDKWNTYAIDGVALEKELWTKIVNDTMSTEEVFDIENAEHRRIAYENMDKIKMKKLKDFKIIHEDVDDYGNNMKIITFNVNDMELKYYNCFCPSTKREYFIATTKDNCHEAKMASFGLGKDDKFTSEY